MNHHRLLKELENGEACTSYLSYVLRVPVNNVSSVLTQLQKDGLVKIVGTEEYRDNQQRPRMRYVYGLTQYGYAKLMGTLAA